MAPAQANPSFKFSKISGESDFHLMVSQDQERLFQQLSNENNQLKDAFKTLQTELLDIVQLKHDIFTQRFKAEFGAHKSVSAETEDAITHHIQVIRDELFNSSFDENGKELIHKFKLNF